jgi:hypothetical protein
MFARPDLPGGSGSAGLSAPVTLREWEADEKVRVKTGVIR